MAVSLGAWAAGDDFEISLTHNFSAALPWKNDLVEGSWLCVCQQCRKALQHCIDT